MAEFLCWLTDSGRLNHKVVTHPASSLVQDRESSPTTMLTNITMRLEVSQGHQTQCHSIC